MLEKLKTELRIIEEAIVYMEASDTMCYDPYTTLCKKAKILKKAIKRLEKIEKKEVHSNGKNSL